MDSPVSGKKYSEVLSVKVSTAVLPYHLHSFQVTQLVPYLNDLCISDSTKCYQDEYATLCWANLDWVVRDNTTNEVDFMKGWSETVSKKFNLP